MVSPEHILAPESTFGLVVKWRRRSQERPSSDFTPQTETDPIFKTHLASAALAANAVTSKPQTHANLH